MFKKNKLDVLGEIQANVKSTVDSVMYDIKYNSNNLTQTQIAEKISNAIVYSINNAFMNLIYNFYTPEEFEKDIGLK